MKTYLQIQLIYIVSFFLKKKKIIISWKKKIKNIII